MQGLLPGESKVNGTPRPDAAQRQPWYASGVLSGPAVRLDTRAKMAICLLASIMSIVIGSPEGQLVLYTFSTLYALGMRRYKLLIIAYLLVTAIMLIACGCVALIHHFFPRMPWHGIFSMAVPFLRLAIMVNVVLPLAFTTPIQSMLTALKSLRLSYYLYIPLAVMVRFIPTFLFDIRQIAEALRIRGYKPGLKQLVLHPLLTMRLVTLPLLFRSLKTSEDLGVAAEMKGLGTSGTLRPYKALIWTRRDTLIMLGACAVSVAAALCHYFFGSANVGGMH